MIVIETCSCNNQQKSTKLLEYLLLTPTSTPNKKSLHPCPKPFYLYSLLHILAGYNTQLRIPMQGDNSNMFNADPSRQVQVREMHFFNQDTQIIRQGQRHKVVFGQMQRQWKPLHEIVSPYLHQFATTTADIAVQAGTTTYQALKVGLLWVYNKFVNNVIPYAVENLPKIVFVTKKQEKQSQPSAEFEVMVNEQDFDRIQRQGQRQGKTKVVVPLGTQNDKHFQEFLKNQKYEIRDYSFPIDVDSEEVRVKESFMIPSESFQVIAEGIKQSYIQHQIPQPQTLKKVAYKLDKCFIFEFEGQNTIEYDMLDSIERSKDTKVGYIVAPEQSLRRTASKKEEEQDPISQLVNGKEPTQHVEQELEKEVDRERKVKVEISERKQRPEHEIYLN